MSGGRCWLVQMCTLSSVGRCFHWMRSSCHFKSAQPKSASTTSSLEPTCHQTNAVLSTFVPVHGASDAASQIDDSSSHGVACNVFQTSRSNTRNLRASRYKQHTHSNGAFEAVYAFERLVLNTTNLRASRSTIIHSATSRYKHRIVSSRLSRRRVRHPLFRK